ncbi:Putative flagellin [gamma proteobacterium HdN1]|nr:Putative flagellin [gamma proteobacterium HdN1]
MAQIINTNVASINAQRNLNKSQGALATSLQRLSSGLRINSAKDDAAGLAISNRFTTQIRGLNVAVRNANDGISFAQTTEGALGETTTALQRIRDLAVQSANGTNSESDRKSLQEEVDQLVSEIDRIAETTTFNGTRVLNGSKDKTTFQIGANANQTISMSGVDARASSLGSQPGIVQSTGQRMDSMGDTGTGAQGLQEDDGSGTATQISDFKIRTANVDANDAVNIADVKFGGNISAANVSDITDRFSANYGSGLAKSVAARINDIRKSGEATMQGVYASAVTTFRGSDVQSGDYAGTAPDANAATNIGAGELKNGDLKINGVDIGAVKFEANDSSGALTNAINAKSDVTGVQASVDRNGELVLTASDGRDIVVNTSDAITTNDLFGGGDEAATPRFDANFGDMRATGRLTVTGTDTLTFDGNADAALMGVDAAGLAAAGSEDNVQAMGTVRSADITSVDAANRTIASIDSALSQVDSFRATMGAIQNRMESTIRNLANVSESLSAANSRILDADFAAETANLSKNQVLQQAGISVLSQANALPQQALSLLR